MSFMMNGNVAISQASTSTDACRTIGGSRRWAYCQGLASVLKKTPGLAFGITTIGLFLGTAPIFFIKLTMKINIVLIIVISIICSIALGYVLKKDGVRE